MTNSHGDHGFGPDPREDSDEAYDRRRDEDADDLYYRVDTDNLAKPAIIDLLVCTN